MESDYSEDISIEDDEDSYQQPPINKNPEVLEYAFTEIAVFFQSYGWICVFVLIVLWILKERVVHAYKKYTIRTEDAIVHKTGLIFFYLIATI